MHTLLAPALQHFVDPRHVALGARASELLEHSLSELSLKHRKYWYERFAKWCAGSDRCALPSSPATLTEYAAYLRAEVGYCDRTIVCALGWIGRTHRNAGFADPREDPRLRDFLKRLRRKGRRVPSRHRPLHVSQLRKVIASIPQDFQGLRDRALLLMCYSAALWSWLIVAIDIEQVEIHRGYLVIDSDLFRYRPLIICSASDPLLCPVRAVRAWLKACGQNSGPLFRCTMRLDYASNSRIEARYVRTIFKRRALDAGVPTRGYCAVSLRRGAIISAAARGTTRVPLMILGRFKLPSSLDPYLHVAARWQTTSKDSAEPHQVMRALCDRRALRWRKK